MRLLKLIVRFIVTVCFLVTFANATHFDGINEESLDNKRVSSTDLMGFENRIGIKSKENQLRFMLFRAKTVQAINSTKEWTNTRNSRWLNQINSYADLDKIPASVQSVIGTAALSSFKSSRNAIVDLVVELLPLKTYQSLFIKYMNSDNPGASEADAMNWLTNNGFSIERMSKKLDVQFLNIMNECNRCFKDIDKSIKKHFSFRITDDHRKDSLVVKHEEEINGLAEELGSVEAVVEKKLGDLQKLFEEIQVDEKKIAELTKYFREVLLTVEASASEKLEMTKKINNGQLSEIAKYFKEKGKLDTERGNQLKEIQDSYNSKMLTIQEGKLYGQVLGQVIGLQDPEAGQKVSMLLSSVMNLAEMTMQFNNPTQSGVQISSALLTGNYIMAGLQIFSMFSQKGEDQSVTFYKNIMQAISDLSNQIHDLGQQLNERFDVVDEKLRFIQTEMVLLFKKTHENQSILIDQNSEIIEMLHGLMNYNKSHYEMVEDAFQDVLTEEFRNCRLDYELFFFEGWAKDKYLTCLRVFYSYSVSLSKNKLFNKVVEDGVPNSLIKSLTHHKQGALENLSFLNDFSMKNLGVELSSSPILNPVMFGYGIELYNSLLNDFLEHHGESLSNREIQNYKTINNFLNKEINVFKNIEDNIKRNEFEIIRFALDDLENKKDDFKVSLYEFHKSFVQEKLGPSARFNFESNQVSNVDVDYNTDTLTMNKCDGLVGKPDELENAFDHKGMENVSIPLTLVDKFVKDVPAYAKLAHKLNYGKIKFCYMITGIYKKTLREIHQSFKNDWGGMGYYSPETWSRIHEDLMSGNLKIKIFTNLYPSGSLVRERRMRLFKEKGYKRKVIRELSKLKSDYKDNSISVLDIIKLPITVQTFESVIDVKNGIYRQTVEPYSYKLCEDSKLYKCEFDSTNDDILYMTKLKRDQDSGEVTSSVKRTVKARYTINLDSSSKVFSVVDMNSLRDSIVSGKVRTNFSLKHLLHFPHKIKNSFENVDDFYKENAQKFSQSYSQALKECLDIHGATCGNKNGEDFREKAKRLKLSIVKVEESNYFINSLLNLSFYDQIIQERKLFNAVNSDVSNLSSSMLRNIVLEHMPKAFYEFSIFNDPADDNLFDDIVESKRLLLNKLEKNNDSRIFNFYMPTRDKV